MFISVLAEHIVVIFMFMFANIYAHCPSGKFHPQVIKTLQNLADLYVTAANGRETQGEQYLLRIVEVHKHNSGGRDTADVSRVCVL